MATSLIDLAMARWFQDDPPGAEPLARKALQIREAKLEPGHPGIVEVQVRLGAILTAEGKAGEAEPLLRNAVESANHPPFALVPWQVAEAESALGTCLVSCIAIPKQSRWCGKGKPIYRQTRDQPFAASLAAVHAIVRRN
jgi:hypothetical protein